MNKKLMTMVDLMTSLEGKRVSFTRGEKVSGRIILISGNDVILELGGKAEGILDKRDLPQEQIMSLKIGDRLQAFVSRAENDTGQILLSPHSKPGRVSEKHFKKWQRFITSLERKTQLLGKIVEANKGGLVVEVPSTGSGQAIRGFLPSSQVGLKELGKESKGGDLQELIGSNINVYVIEVSPENNRLIFSSRRQINEALKAQLNKYEIGQKITGKIAGFAPFGLIIDLDGLEGVIYQQEISWFPEDQKTMDNFSVGQEIKAGVVGIDENLGRVNLSIRQLSDDPIEKMLQQYGEDGVVGGIVSEVNSSGVTVKLPEDLEGIIPLEKIGLLTKYQVGEQIPAFVDGVDKIKRKLNLVPFLTSTKGLIYK